MGDNKIYETKDESENLEAERSKIYISITSLILMLISIFFILQGLGGAGTSTDMDLFIGFIINFIAGGLANIAIKKERANIISKMVTTLSLILFFAYIGILLLGVTLISLLEALIEELPEHMG